MGMGGVADGLADVLMASKVEFASCSWIIGAGSLRSLSPLLSVVGLSDMMPSIPGDEVVLVREEM